MINLEKNNIYISYIMNNAQFTTGGSSTGGFPNTEPLGNKWNLIEQNTLLKKVTQVMNSRKNGLRTFYIDIDYGNRTNNLDLVNDFTVIIPPRVRSFNPNVKVFLSLYSYSLKSPLTDYPLEVYIELDMLNNEINNRIVSIPSSPIIKSNTNITLIEDSYHIDNITELTRIGVKMVTADGSGGYNRLTNEEITTTFLTTSFNLRLRFVVDIEVE